MLEDAWEGQISYMNTKTDRPASRKLKSRDRKEGATDLGASTVSTWLDGKATGTECPGHSLGLGGQEVL